MVLWQVCGLVSMLGKAAAVTINNGLGCPGSQGLWKDLRFTGWPSSPLAGRRRSCTSAHLGHGGKQSYGLKWWGNTCESELATVCTNWYISDVQTGKEEPGCALCCWSCICTKAAWGGCLEEMPPMQVSSALYHLFSCFSFYFFFHTFLFII